MTDAHTVNDRLDALWREHDRIITQDDWDAGKPAEAIRWCRDRLGGRDEDLVGPLRWAEASDNGWSERAVYGCLPSCGPGKTWRRYSRDLALYVYLLQPSPNGGRNVDDRSTAQAGLELELATLVAGWLADEARGVKRSFAPLVLSRPPDLTQPQKRSPYR